MRSSLVLTIVAIAFTACGQGAARGVRATGSTGIPDASTIPPSEPTTNSLPATTVTEPATAPVTVARTTLLPSTSTTFKNTTTTLDATTVEQQIQAQMSGSDQFISVGHLDQIVKVHLRADAAKIAAELHDRYGPTVRIRLGRYPYPPGAPDIGPPEAACGLVANPEPTASSLTASIELDSTSIASGKDGLGHIHVVNNGSAPVRVNSGDFAIGAVVTPGSRQVVGSFVGSDLLSLHTQLLQAGDSADFKFVFGTASCDPATGYALAPGTYEVIAMLPPGGVDPAPAQLVVTSN